MVNIHRKGRPGIFCEELKRQWFQSVAGELQSSESSGAHIKMQSPRNFYKDYDQQAEVWDLGICILKYSR